MRINVGGGHIRKPVSGVRGELFTNGKSASGVDDITARTEEWLTLEKLHHVFLCVCLLWYQLFSQFTSYHLTTCFR